MLANEKITLRNQLGFNRTRIPGVEDYAAPCCCRLSNGRLRSRSHKSRRASTLGAGVARDPGKLAGEVDVILSSRASYLSWNRQRAAQCQARYPDYRAEHDRSRSIPGVTPGRAAA